MKIRPQMRVYHLGGFDIRHIHHFEAVRSQYNRRPAQPGNQTIHYAKLQRLQEGGGRPFPQIIMQAGCFL